MKEEAWGETIKGFASSRFLHERLAWGMGHGPWGCKLRQRRVVIRQKLHGSFFPVTACL